MTVALLPVLPIIGGESLTSYLARVARFHGGVDVYRFLSLIELSRHDAMLPGADVIERISALTGQPAEVISRMTFQRHGARMRSICGEPVYAEFANLDQTSYCPACLLEDSQADSPSHGVRLGRVAWMIEPMRACRRHGIALVRRKNSASAEKFQLMAEVAPDDRSLEAQAGSVDRCDSSTLLDYIENRLAGEQGPSWLDGQQIDLAVRACEMLGLILTAGTHVDLKKITQSEWVEAGSVGYGFASRGYEGVHEGLQLAFDRFAARGLRGGPQKVFGRLYQWLQFNKNNKPFGPIREVVREFVLDNFPVEAGTDLLGAPVDRQRVHSVASLARKTGEHPKTINRAVVLTGLIDGDPDRPQAHNVFEASEGEALIHRIQNSIPVLRLQEHLNCNRVQAEQLVRTAVIPRILDDAERAAGVLKHVAIEDADDFLARLLAAAEKVDAPSEGVMDIVAAAEMARWPVIDIVNGILAGLFSNVEIVDRELKFKGVLVDPLEVREVLSREKEAGRVGIDEAARILGMTRFGVSTLAKMRTPLGEAYLSEHYFENGKGVRTRLFAVEELQAFVRDHISLMEYARSLAFSSKVMKVKLDRHRIEPITAYPGLGRLYYRKQDLAGYQPY